MPSLRLDLWVETDDQATYERFHDQFRAFQRQFEETVESCGAIRRQPRTRTKEWST